MAPQARDMVKGTANTRGENIEQHLNSNDSVLYVARDGIRLKGQHEDSMRQPIQFLPNSSGITFVARPDPIPTGVESEAKFRIPLHCT